MKHIPNFENKKTALLLIDIQKCYGTEDPEASAEDWGTWEWVRAGNNATKVLESCRKKGYKIIHVGFYLDDHTIHPFDDVDEFGHPIYSVKGEKGSEFIDSIEILPNEVHIEKQRVSAFYQTNLDLILKRYGIEHLIMVGGFSTVCLLTTAYDAWARDFTISFVKDAITAESEGGHKAGMITMANWIYGCSIYDTNEFIKALEGKEHSAWYWEKGGEFPFVDGQLNEIYEKLK